MSMTFVVYKAYDASGSILYIGQSSSFGYRMDQHCHNSEWTKLVARIDVIHCDTKEEMTNLERSLISEIKPPHNRQLFLGSSERIKSINACKRTRRSLAGELFRDHVRSAISKLNGIDVPKPAIRVAYSPDYDVGRYKADLKLCDDLKLPLTDMEYKEMFNNSSCKGSLQ